MLPVEKCGLDVAMWEGGLSPRRRTHAGRLETEELAVEVRASIVTTTTAPALNDENQTRVFDLWIDESTSLTAEVIRSYADIAAVRFRVEGGMATVYRDDIWEAQS